MRRPQGVGVCVCAVLAGLPLEGRRELGLVQPPLHALRVSGASPAVPANPASLLARPPRPGAELQCWAFNPPGGLLSWELSQIAQAYCTALVVGKDLISRLR